MIGYKLKFTTPLHLSAGYGGYETTFQYLHSDTLFSAILSNWNHFYDEAIDSIIQDLPFQISSGFPFSSNDYYFPKPLKSLPIVFDKEDNSATKKLRKVKFIEKELLEKMLKNESIDNKGIYFSESKQLMSSKKNVSDFFVVKELSRNVVDRVNGATELFYFSELVFQKDSGLFFLATFNNDEMRKKFETVLRLLGDEGIGGDRSVGKGLFEVEVIEDFQLKQPAFPDSILTLSLYHPTFEEIGAQLLKNASYDMINRKGWITSSKYKTLRKKSINMFLEGSIFNDIKKNDYGDIPIVAEKTEGVIDFNVYRYGKGFFVNCLNGESDGKKV